MNRKKFIHSGLLLAAPMLFPVKNLEKNTFSNSFLMTVNGPISLDKAGLTLPHEHVLVDFIGADKVNVNRYNRDDVFETALPYLKQAKTLGCHTLVECTPAWLGRDVRLLQKLAIASNLHIITNTGYYGASQEKYLPSNTYTDSAEKLASYWTGEWEDGIDGTDIKPGFIKSGVDSHPLTKTQRKLIEAAALTHLNTGLTIGIHTGSGKAALEEMNIIKSMGVRPSAWIWIHAQNESNRSTHLQVAEAGGWVSFDGLTAQSVGIYTQFLKDMKAHQLLNKALISHDAGWYHVGEPKGGNFRPYDTVFKILIPILRKEGFSKEDIDLLFHSNPINALAIADRKKI
ncbi:phosphotriesterase [Olivibacter sp. SDN3]|uniref:phosphotriesterase family protein n=1 Tax=Olivibacter sp. SDN3 TaxID=2764720 RepID=UPI001650D677|nr:phosphotriesterase [Olivibacter sp. SDN3]QNL49408.1 phosphotriesterase [Olivibacter sp. SDN3]